MQSTNLHPFLRAGSTPNQVFKINDFTLNTPFEQMIIQELVPFLGRVEHQQAPQSIEVQYPIEELQKMKEQKGK